MRLWTLHPRYLDARGLVAAWREGLLAQAVLSGQTRGYGRHPQLSRFRRAKAPLASIRQYLAGIRREATRRGYAFDAGKIRGAGGRGRIRATAGQLEYEWRHLKTKLRVRNPEWLRSLDRSSSPAAHPLFRIVPGPVAEWEMIGGAASNRKISHR
jgi:hypothetical protein